MAQHDFRVRKMDLALFTLDLVTEDEGEAMRLASKWAKEHMDELEFYNLFVDVVDDNDNSVEI